MNDAQQMLLWKEAPENVLIANGMKPDPWQLELLRNPANRILCRAPRQGGKSTAAAAWAITEALRKSSDPGAVVLIISPTLRQAGILLGRVRSLILNGRCGVKIDADREDRLRIAGGAEIRSVPDNPDTICGFTARAVVLEEAARISDRGWDTAMACLSATGGRALAISTGTSQGTRFFRAAGSDKWESVIADWRRCPRLSENVVREMAETMPAGVFKAEYEGGFYDAESKGVISACPQVIAGAPTVEATVGGIDWGFRDPTAAIWGHVNSDGVLVLLGELYQTGLVPEEVATRLPRHVQWWADPANPRENHELIRRGHKVVKGVNSIEAGFAQINWMIREGRLRVVQGACNALEMELKRLEYRMTGDRRTRLPTRAALTIGPDHAIAALRYLVLGLPRRSAADRPPPSYNLYTEEQCWTKLQ